MRFHHVSRFAAFGVALSAALLAATAAYAGTYGKNDKPDIVDTAIAVSDFTTLASALQAGGLIDTLKVEGPCTVFAPTDAAFAKLPAGTIESLLLPENTDKLAAVPTHHVVPGKVEAAQVVTMTSAPTANGKELATRVAGERVSVDAARVVATDIAASTGVFRVVDTVILAQG
jgi:uncharacterized surface protein with fasciclin (FAS1) repeats